MARLAAMAILCILICVVGCKKKEQPQAAPQPTTSTESPSPAPQTSSGQPQELASDSPLRGLPEWEAVRNALASLDPSTDEYRQLKSTIETLEMMAAPGASSEAYASALKSLGPSLGIVVELQLANLEYQRVALRGNPWQTDAAATRFTERLQAARNRWTNTRITTPLSVERIDRNEVTVNADLSFASLLSTFHISFYIGSPRLADTRGMEGAEQLAHEVASDVMFKRLSSLVAAQSAAKSPLGQIIEQRTGAPVEALVTGGFGLVFALNPTFMVGWLQVPGDVALSDAMQFEVGQVIERTLIVDDILGDDPLGGHTVVARWETTPRSLSPAYLAASHVAEQRSQQDARRTRAAELLRRFKAPSPEPGGLHFYAARGVVVNPDANDARPDLQFLLNKLQDQLGVRARGLLHRKSTDSTELAYIAGRLSERDAAGWTPLHYAAALGHTEAVAFLTAEYCHPLTHSGQFVEACNLQETPSDPFMLTPLHLAAAGGHTETVKALLAAIRGDHRIDQQEVPAYSPGDPRYNPAVTPGQVQQTVTTPLWRLIESRSPYVFGRPDIVYSYISPERIEKPRKVWEDQSMFHPGVIRFGQQNGGLLNENKTVSMFPPTIDEPDANGLSALDYARIMGHDDVVQLLRQHGAAGRLP